MSANRSGMTLIEVLIAITIVSVSMISMSAYMTKFSRSIAASHYREVANEMASSRIEEVKGAPHYLSIDSLYGGEETFSTGKYKGFKRKTVIQRLGGGEDDLFDYTTVTVLIHSSYFSSPVSKTSIIAAF